MIRSGHAAGATPPGVERHVTDRRRRPASPASVAARASRRRHGQSRNARQARTPAAALRRTNSRRPLRRPIRANRVSRRAAVELRRNTKVGLGPCAGRPRVCRNPTEAAVSSRIGAAPESSPGRGSDAAVLVLAQLGTDDSGPPGACSAPRPCSTTSSGSACAAARVERISKVRPRRTLGPAVAPAFPRDCRAKPRHRNLVVIESQTLPGDEPPRPGLWR